MLPVDDHGMKAVEHDRGVLGQPADRTDDPVEREVERATLERAATGVTETPNS